jgi:hypothetical protein
MVSWPDIGTRVTVRYRRPAGSVPPLTDAVGHLLAVDPMVRVRTKRGTVVECAPADVVALRVLTDAPVRTAQIRALEHAAAAGWPGAEHAWLDGWLLRAGPGATLSANSAVPLDISAQAGTIPAIVDWYTSRGLPPRLAIPDRLLTPPAGLATEHTERVLVRDVRDLSGRDPYPDHPAASAAVTDAPDGTRWVGVSPLREADDPNGRLVEALLAWGVSRGATRGYVWVPDTATTALAESLGFRLHHRRRYLRPPDSL